MTTAAPARDVPTGFAREGFRVIFAEVEQSQGPTAELALSLLEAAEMGGLVLDHMNGQLHKLMACGSEGRRLAYSIKEFLDVLDLARQTFEATEKYVRSTRLDPHEEDDYLRRLRDRSARTSEIQARWRSLLQWLERPLPTIDPAQLPSAGQENAADYVGHDVLLERLGVAPSGGAPLAEKVS